MNAGFQEKANLLANFLATAENADGYKIFLPYANQENWERVFKRLRDYRVLSNVDITNFSYSALRELSTLIDDLDFLYAFFQELDSINIFKFLSDSDLEITSFKEPHSQGYSSEVHIPGNISLLPQRFFGNCTELKKLVFDTPASIQTLSAELLLNCRNLRELVLPDTIRYIGYLAVDPDQLPGLKIYIDRQGDEKQKIRVVGDSEVQEYWKSHIIYK